ncbi:sulfotransferase domain-containing protein [Haliangium ochraceum]|uniref:Sulfotransferase n=1 Tax=Haliangium ochraceum (strain DSM 14365 / JCM 11303 / SMP-2) TaxID=502025 RepID=D0LVM1_HALO1|nr:sulfotransferase domain-containing protein [Haliangium ochraceum]ACY17582.1 sulfotransferase [Haliangium ochraceum DSM 14365]
MNSTDEQHKQSDSALPVCNRVYQNHHLDSTVWERVEARPDDIVIATAYKSGTTWMQQIIGTLIFQDQEPPDAVTNLSPWVDMRIEVEEKLAALQAQTHRRFLKTHLPLDGLPYRRDTKYVYVGRDGRDVFMSFYNHYRKGNDTWYSLINDTPGLVGPPLPRCPEDPLTWWDQWLSKPGFPWEKDGYPFWSLFDHMRSWWEYRHLPNILLVHFNDLKRDLSGEIARIADFLDIDIDDEMLAKVTEKCTFDYMKQNASKVMPMGDEMFTGGAKSFINKGTNGRWRDVLPPEEVERYEAIVAERLSPECARWLATGELPD